LRIAFVTDQIPRPNRSGYLAYNHALMSALVDRGHEVTLVLAGQRLGAPVVRYDDVFDADRVRVVGPDIRSFHGGVAVRGIAGQARARARWAMARLPGGMGENLRRHAWTLIHGPVDSVLGQFLNGTGAEAAARLAASADITLVDTIFRAAVLDGLPPDQPRGIITHDVFSERHAALSARGMRLVPRGLTEAEEVALLRRAPLLVAIQDSEAAILRRLVPAATVVTAPMPARLVPRPASQPRQAGRIVYVGSAAPHNIDGMRWFLEQVWPLVARDLPSARLDIIGGIGSMLGTLPDGVVAHGIVADIGPALHGACLAIAPLLAGSGQAIKLVTYTQHGLMTVTTTQGAAGYTHDEGWPFTLADSPVDFASAVAQLAATDGTAREPAAMAYLARFEPARALKPFIDAIEATRRQSA
jgi:hypothetical protein